MGTKQELPKPEQRSVTIVHRYWWCGAQRCTRMHKSEDSAESCPKRNTNPLPNKTQRNQTIWQLVIEEGKTLTEAGREVGLSPERTRQVVCKIARRMRIDYRAREPGQSTADRIRSQLANRPV